MTFWRKSNGFEDFLDIARFVLDKEYIIDRTEYRTYPHPFYHVKMPYTVKGLETELKEWKKEYEEYEENNVEHWQLQMIFKLNLFLAYNLKWKNSKSAQQQFKDAAKIHDYFKRERDFLATN